MANVIQTFPKGTGSGGGHTIIDGEGTALTQEKNLQIEGLDVADDSTNEATVFSPIGLNADSIDDIAEANSVVPAVIIGDSNNYSTNEKVVGKWIDGRPIYQKTIVGTLPTAINSIQNFAIHGIANIDLIQIVSSCAKGTDGTRYSLGIDTVWVAWANYENIRNQIQNSSLISQTGYITIQYTKTT